MTRLVAPVPPRDRGDTLMGVNVSWFPGRLAPSPEVRFGGVLEGIVDGVPEGATRSME